MPALLENLSSKIQTAKDSGYKENEILDYLGSQGMQDKIKTARDSGYKDTEIIDYLSKTDVPSVRTDRGAAGMPSPAKQGEQPDFESMIKEIEKPPVDLSRLPGAGIARKTQELGTEMLLGAAGGALGTAAVPGVGGLLGAGAGYALGRRLNELARGEQYPIGESFEKAAKETALGTTFEGAGQLAGKAIGKISGLYKSRADKEFIKQAKELGVKPTPADITKSKTLSFLEANMRRLYGSGKLFHEGDVENTQKLIDQYKNAIASGKGASSVEELGIAIKNNVDEFVGRADVTRGKFLNRYRNILLKDLGSPDTYEQLGSGFHQSVVDESQALKKVVNDSYEEVKGMIGAAIPKEQQNVPLTETKKVAEKYIKELSATPILQREYKGIISDLDNVVSTNKSDWDSTELARRLYRDAAVKADEAFQAKIPGGGGQIKEGKSQEALIYGKLRNALEIDQETFTKSLGKGIQEKYEAAKGLSRTLKQKFRNPAILKLVKTHPGEVVDEILKPGGYAEVEAVQNAIGNDNFNKIVKPGITNKLLGVGTDEIFNPAHTEKQLSRLNTQLLNKIYTPSEFKTITDMAKKGTNFSNKELYPSFLKPIAESGKESAYGIAKQAFSQDGKYLTRNLSTLYKLSDQATKDELKYQMTVQLFTGKQPPGATDPMSIGAREPRLIAFSGKAFTKQLNKFYPLLKTFGYSGEDIALMKKIANVADRLGGSERLAQNVSGTGQAIATQAQITAAISLLFSGHPVTAGAVMGAPYIIAKAYMSPTGRKLLSEGLKIPAETPQAVEWLTKMGTYSMARNTGENNQ